MLFTAIIFTSLLVPSNVFADTAQTTTAVPCESSCSPKITQKLCSGCPHTHQETKITKEFEAIIQPTVHPANPVIATPTATPAAKTTIATATEQQTILLATTQTTIAVTESVISTATNAQSAQNVHAKKRPVTVVVDMPKKSLGYKHFFGTYYPTEFYLTVNGKKTGPEETVTIDCENDCVDITYYAQFQNGRETSRQYVYAIDPKKEQVTATFAWKVDNRVMLDDEKAQLTSFVEIIP